MSIIIIAAMDENNGIGVENKIPWHIPTDMKFFKAITTEATGTNYIAMGRKTAESLGRPLPNRINIVLTRDKDSARESLGDGFVFTEVVGYILEISKNKDVYIIGGAEIYKLFLPFANKIYITKINDTFKCDTFMPTFDEREFSIETSSFKENGYECSFNIFKRYISN